MPEFRVSLSPSLRHVSLLWLLSVLLLTAPTAAQSPRILPRGPAPLPAARIASRPVLVEPAAGIGTVTLSREEYERLKSAARGAAKNDAGARTSAVVTEAHYTAAISDGAATIACRFVVQVLNGPWAEIPINFGDAAVGVLATDKGTTAYLRGLDHGKYMLAVKETGRHEIRLELRTGVKSLSAGSGFSFSGPAAGIATLDVSVPTAGQQISVSPTFVPQRVTAKTGTSRVKGHLAAASKITVSWQSERTSAADMRRVVSIDNRTQLRLQEETLLTEAMLTYHVHRGQLTSLQIIAPANDRILDVSSAKGAMSGWSVAKDKDRQTITVKLSRPVSDRVQVTVRTERTIAEGTVFVAGRDGQRGHSGIHAADSDRETGLLVLSHIPRWNVSLPSQPGWVPVESSEIPGEIAKAGAQYVRYFHPRTPFSIHLQPVKPRMSVTHNARINVRPVGIDVTTRLTYQVDRIGVTKVTLRLPTGTKVDRVSGDHVKSFSQGTASSVLLVEFDRRVTGSVAMTIESQHAVTKPDHVGEFELPVIEPEGVDRESGRVELLAADAVDVLTVPARTSGVTTVASRDSSEDGLRRLSAWSFDARPFKITVSRKRRSPRVTAKLGTVVDVRESNIGITTDLEFHVSQAPARTLRFAVPAAVADSLRITDAAGTMIAARQSVTTAKPAKKAAESKRTWTVLEIEPPQPVTGTYRLKIRYDLESPKIGSKGEPLRFEPIRVLDLASTSELHGEISVTHARRFQLAIQSRGGDIEPVDGRELSFLPATDADHFRYQREPVSLSIGITPLEVETVAETVVSRGLVEILLTDDATAAYRARYRILSSARQRLRVDLPKSCEPLGAFVNGAAVTLERDPSAKESDEWSAHLINVSRPLPPGEEFVLAIQFRMPVKPAPFQVSLGRLQLKLPRILNPSGSAAVVQQMRTVVWVPDGQSLLGAADGFARQTTTRLTGPGPRGVSSRIDANELEAWIGVESPRVFEFPTQGHAYRFDSVGSVDQLEIATANMPFATWVLSLPLLLIGYVLARTPWRNRLNLSLLLLFAAAIAAVSWSDAIWHLLLAARYGLVGVAVLWLTRAVFVGGKSRKTSEIAGPPEVSCPLPIAGLATVVIPHPGLFSRNS